jgi:hypothetical protein
MDLYRQLGGLLGRVICLISRPLSPQENTNTEEKRADFHLRVGFEPTTIGFERAKTIHDLDTAAAVMGRNKINYAKQFLLWAPLHFTN